VKKVWPFSLFKRKVYRFSEEERKAGSDNASLRREIERQKLEHERKMLELRSEREELKERAEIADLRAELEEEQEDYVNSEGGQSAEWLSVLKMFAPEIKSAFLKNNSSVQPPAPSAVQRQPTDDELNAIWESTPPHIKALAKRMSDDAIRDFVLKQNPNMNDESIGRIIGIVRGRAP